MKTKDIIFLVFFLLVAGFSLYRKYIKKNAGNDKDGSATKSSSQFSSNSKNDDYEPYSGSKR
jgi:hypothetical protein